MAQDAQKVRSRSGGVARAMSDKMREKELTASKEEHAALFAQLEIHGVVERLMEYHSSRVVTQLGLKALCPLFAGPVTDLLRSVVVHALAALAADPAARKKMAEAGRARAPAYGVEQMVEKIEALYEEVLTEKGMGR